MKRTALVIAKDELHKQFSANARQDVKIVVPGILTEELFLLLEKNRFLKPETPLDGEVWSHAPGEFPNQICLATDFSNADSSSTQGSFSLSFANEKAEQHPHYHRRHIEIYFSEHPLHASFRGLEEKLIRTVSLDEGGAVVFAPDVVHQVTLGGLTMVIEIPAVPNDKVNEAL